MLGRRRRRRANIVSRVCLAGCMSGQQTLTQCRSIVPKLAYRLRRWPSIETTCFQLLVFAASIYISTQQTQDVGPMFF